MPSKGSCLPRMDPTTALHILAEKYQSGHHLHTCILVTNNISATVSQVYLEISNQFLFSLTVFTVCLQRACWRCPQGRDCHFEAFVSVLSLAVWDHWKGKQSEVHQVTTRASSWSLHKGTSQYRQKMPRFHRHAKEKLSFAQFNQKIHHITQMKFFKV